MLVIKLNPFYFTFLIHWRSLNRLMNEACSHGSQWLIKRSKRSQQLTDDKKMTLEDFTGTKSSVFQGIISSSTDHARRSQTTVPRLVRSSSTGKEIPHDGIISETQMDFSLTLDSDILLMHIPLLHSAWDKATRGIFIIICCQFNVTFHVPLLVYITIARHCCWMVLFN